MGVLRHAKRGVRLDRALSKLGVASRAEARRLVAEGRVQIGGRLATNPGALVVPETTRIVVDGRPARVPVWRTIALHKPRSVLTTARDPEGRRTVFDVLGLAGQRLVAVGRLDMASTGLLLLTTDTQLAGWLTDPGQNIIRRYVVTARGAVNDEAARAMERGIDRLRAHAVVIRKRSAKETHLVIELTEGRNREVRRLLEATGHEVTRLRRVAFGGIELGTLAPGAWREISRAEVRAAFPDWAG